ncbi:MAG: TfpX/TfpZ family type IV pilin accessory protein [Methylococcales bacterium]
MNRWQASGIHLSICVLIALTVVSTMLFVWYPASLLEALGGQKIVMMVIAIDVIIGPLLTLIVFRPFKKGLKFDLSVIVALQIAALLYGVSVLFQGRPVYMVFVKDRFDVVTAVDVDAESLARVSDEQFKQLPLTGPKLAAAKIPIDPKERERILFSAIDHGRDLQCFPEYYQPYEDQVDTILKKSLLLTELRAKRPESVDLIDEFVDRFGASGGKLIFLPVTTPKDKDLTAVIDPGNGQIVEILNIDPWI